MSREDRRQNRHPMVPRPEASYDASIGEKEKMLNRSKTSKSKSQKKQFRRKH